jgi:hypothetical protein
MSTVEAQRGLGTDPVRGQEPEVASRYQRREQLTRWRALLGR